MKFGEFIKDIRQKNKLSQRQLAELCNVSNTEISRIESGERQNPSPAILKAMAPYLGVSYGELMIKVGYIEENIADEEYISQIFKNSSNELANTLKIAQSIHDKDSEILPIMNEAILNLPKEDIKSIKEFAKFYLYKQENK